MRIAIIGLGLIGGSLGLALKQFAGSEYWLIGYARRAEVAEAALRRGAVDRVETSLSRTVEGADLVIIATPVLTIKDILSQIAACLPPGCVVSDTGSTKVQVLKWAREILPPSVDFVGGHPLAGKEIQGIEAAQADLFQGCLYCLTPWERTCPSSLEKVMALVRKLGARPYLIDAREHDELVAGISHLPMLLSAVLVSVTSRDPSWSRMSQLAASGYRDVTRLASGDPEVNAHICLTNREAILSWLDKFARELQRYRRILASDDEGIKQALIEANRARQEWLNQRH